MFDSQTTIENFDPEIYSAIKKENERQEKHIELIASENYASPSVMAAQGSQLTNKYAEGYPGKRYYGGCEYIDVIERLAIERVKLLYNADYANVQPHSGSQANAAVYFALLNPGDTVLGMSLSEGGHLTHGTQVNFSGKLFNCFHYGLESTTGDINYCSVATLAKKYQPKMIIAGFSAFSGIVDWAKFRKISDSVGAYLMVDMAHVSGLIAAGIYPSPIPFADVVTSTTHKTLRGPRGGFIVAKSNPKLEKKLQSIVFPGTQGGPLMHVIAAKAVAFKEALSPKFIAYQIQVVKNAKKMAKVLISREINIVSNGTKNHLILINLIDRNLTGKKVEKSLECANIAVNKNTVPNDLRSPFVTSGLRIGTPAITTRGFQEAECTKIGHWIADIIDNPGNKNVESSIKEKVITLCRRFPVYNKLG